MSYKVEGTPIENCVTCDQVIKQFYEDTPYSVQLRLTRLREQFSAEVWVDFTLEYSYNNESALLACQEAYLNFAKWK